MGVRGDIINLTSKPVPLPLELAKKFAIRNMDFMITSADNLKVQYPKFGFETTKEKLSQIKAEIQNQNKTNNTAEIREFVKIFTTPEFNQAHFFNRDFSNKLSQFLAILDTS